MQFAGRPTWAAARFTIAATPAGPDLMIHRQSNEGAVAVHLRDVTALDELLSGPPDSHHLEIAVDRQAIARVVWQPSFTDEVLAALAATVEPATGRAESVTDIRTGHRRSNAGVIAALALVGCGAVIVGALGLRDPDPGRPAETAVLTQTTLRGPATTAPGGAGAPCTSTATSTTTMPAPDGGSDPC